MEREKRRRLGLPDDVGEVGDGVHRRFELSGAERDGRGERLRCALLPLEGPARGRLGAAHGRSGAADEGSHRRAGEQQDACGQRGDPCDQHARVAHERADPFLERASHVAAVSAEDEHEPQRAHEQSGAERPELHDRAPAEHERADDDERGR